MISAVPGDREGRSQRPTYPAATPQLTRTNKDRVARRKADFFEADASSRVSFADGGRGSDQLDRRSHQLTGKLRRRLLCPD